MPSSNNGTVISRLFEAFYYRQTSSLGPWKFVLDIGRSSHLGLINAPGREANGYDFGLQ